MNLIVHELTSEVLEQSLTTGNDPVQLEAVRPHLYKHNNPAGNLYVELRNSSGALLKTSSAVSVQSITDISNAYFHGYVRFNLKAGLLPNTTYLLRLVSSGYAFSESAYVGWCNDYDLRKYDVDYIPSGNTIAPLDIEAWEMKQVRKGEL